MSLAPNALETCPSDAHRRTAWAHGKICLTCEPDAEWMARCPLCLDDVPAVGLMLTEHDIDGTELSFPCPASGDLVDPPLWAEPERVAA